MANNFEMTSLRTHVRRYIIDGIASGQFCPGDKISEQEIATALGVSRTPTREALLQLNSEGLLDYQPRKGFSIKQMSEAEKREMYELVAMLDAYCARCTAESLTEQDFRQMHELIDRIDIAIKYQNMEEYRRLEMDFHNVYRCKTGNKTILHVLELVESGVIPTTFVGDDIDEMTKIYQMLNGEHRHILELLEKRDSIGVETYLLEIHWANRLPEFTQLKHRETKS